MPRKESEDIMIICGEGDGSGFPGAYRRCFKCKCKVFLCDSSIESIPKEIKHLPIILYCPTCAVPNLPPKENWAPLSDLQKKEITEWVKRKTH